mmetsp:Transcript_665/g.1196  ORF Transcript_665/g.1196 Transcript_665/m.1196 type:complete len:619 (+) Transcript_665:38-1894(+)
MSLPSIPATLKWGKQLFPGLVLHPGSCGDVLKQEIYVLTGVPIERQRVMCRGAWQGALKDGAVINELLTLSSGQSELTVMLIGTAEAAPAKPPEETKFVEDLSAEEVAAAAAAAAAAELEAAEGLIIALQRLPAERNDKKKEMYKYNHFVTGLPQRQIEDMLQLRRERGSGTRSMLGECAMTLGVELGPYVNEVSVLHDGTLVSVTEDGHVKLWRHGVQVRDTVHRMPEAIESAGLGPSGGITCLAPVPPPAEHGVAFATGGNACIKLWTVNGDCVQTLMAPIFPGVGQNVVSTTPTNLVAMQFGASGASCLAATFRNSRELDPHAFHLVPQNAEEQRRRAQAELEETQLRQKLAQLVRSVQVWALQEGAREADFTNLQTWVLYPGDDAMAAPITALAAMPDSAEFETRSLVCGDAAGGLRFWSKHSGSADESWQQLGLLQLCLGSDASTGASSYLSVVCMVPLVAESRNLLAVSTEARSSLGIAGRQHLPGAVELHVPSACVVSVVDVAAHALVAVLNAHQDTVHCMCALPDGGLATGGGKRDATVRVWESSQFRSMTETAGGESGAASATPVLSEAAAKLKEPGYVFALTALPDAKPGSGLFALAAARYNVVKICL